jgi:hypothetical protein
MTSIINFDIWILSLIGNWKFDICNIENQITYFNLKTYILNYQDIESPRSPSWLFIPFIGNST